ncbi:hypothetical protein EV421DRAFT_1913623 [Armillaria borealis]|uniref:F-box domain-containing protein n=1 Tax=Armillaria borealis TaxID=47425 RepID=A0AA39IUG5_9AGAR|nr:hypothetical protein EV421DRAFT_1913623 [Armillaria borealis]
MEAIPLSPSPEIIEGLTHNLPPSDAIRPAVLAKIQECQHFIATVNRFGHRLVVKDHLFLSMEKAKAEKLLVHLKLILHPIRCLPDNVLLELFTLVIDFTGTSAVSTDMVLWACARVCQWWRALILDTPSLWSDVHLNFDDDIYLRYHLPRAERILVERLERSGSHLLNIFICGPCAHPDTNRILSRLLTSAARWRSLTVDAGPEVYKMFEKCPGESLTELCTLSIADSIYMEGEPDEEDRYTGVILKAFCCTPKLRRLFLSPLPLSSLSLSAETMYNNIQEFSVNLFHQLPNVSRLLPAMRALKSLDILCDEKWRDDDDMIHLPLLSEITLREYNNTHDIPDTWTKLNLPNVKSLQLAYEGVVLHLKLPLFDKHNPRITEFTCYVNSFADSGFPDFERDLIMILQSLPNITTLRLSSCHTTPILLEKMRSDTCFLPALMDITLLWIMPSFQVPDDDIFLLIDTLHTQARSATCATVKHLAFESDITLYEELTPYTTMWEELRNGGLEVVEFSEPLF